MQYSHEGVGRGVRKETAQYEKFCPEAADLRLGLGRSEALRLSGVSSR